MIGTRSNPGARGAAPAAAAPCGARSVPGGGGGGVRACRLGVSWALGGGAAGGMRRARRLARKLRQGGTIRVLPVALSLGAPRWGCVAPAEGWTSAVAASAEASLGLVTAKPAEAREERTANDAPRAAAAARGPRRRRRPASGGSRGGAGARSSGRRGGGPAGAGKPSGPVTPRQIAFRKRMGVSAPAVPTRALTRPMLPRPDRPPWKERPRP